MNFLHMTVTQDMIADVRECLAKDKDMEAPVVGETNHASSTGRLLVTNDGGCFVLETPLNNGPSVYLRLAKHVLPKHEPVWAEGWGTVTGRDEDMVPTDEASWGFDFGPGGVKPLDVSDREEVRTGGRRSSRIHKEDVLPDDDFKDSTTRHKKDTLAIHEPVWWCIFVTDNDAFNPDHFWASVTTESKSLAPSAPSLSIAALITGWLAER